MSSMKVSAVSEVVLASLAEALEPGRPIAVDCDGVILDYDAPFSVVAQDVLGRPVQRQNRIYELDVRYGISSEELDQVFAAYRTHPQGLRGLPMLEGAADVLRALRQMGHPLHMVTGIDEENSPQRRENLALYGIEMDEIHCVGAGRKSKADVLRRINPGMFFDDRLHLLAEADNVPHRVWIDHGDDQYGLTCPEGVLRCTGLTQWFGEVFHPHHQALSTQSAQPQSGRSSRHSP